LPYVWRADGKDADLRVGGRRVPVTFAHSGNDLSINYSVPNKNQCKQCHSAAGNIMPIGPLWQNMAFPRPADARAIVKAVPALARLQPYPKWDDSRTGSLDDRARQYLNVNCGHCHAPQGSASTSGLFLDGSATGAAALRQARGCGCSSRSS
jgi:mono/diheme cytochrome c family protein